MWTEETARAFDDLDGGSETAMKDYGAITVHRIYKLIERVRHDLGQDLRVKIITIITIDVHERDVILDLVDRKIVESSHFKWQSQLKFYMEQKDPRD
jgi:dynein heavy chain